MNLSEAILQWNGKSADDIKQIFHSHNASSDFVTELLHGLVNSELSKGATWLLKSWLEDGNSFSESQSLHVINSLEKLDHWESRLHILQCFNHLSVPSSSKIKVETFLRSCLNDKNKFIRAWTYNAWYLFAQSFPEYKAEVEQFIEMAMRDEAPSVKARIRNLGKSAS